MSKLRDPKKFKIYIQTIMMKKSETISKKIFGNFVTGLFELNKIFKDYMNMKFVMKMKSEMDQEKQEEEKILEKDDYKSPKDVLNNYNNLNTPRSNQIKTEIYNKAQLRKNLNSNKESENLQTKKIESNFLNFPAKNQQQLNNPYDKNKNNQTTLDNPSNSNIIELQLRQPFYITKKIIYLQQEISNRDNKEQKQIITKSNPLNIQKLDNKIPHKPSQSFDNTPKKIQSNLKINSNNEKMENTVTTIKKPDENEYSLNTRSNQNFNNTTINLKQKILDQITRPGEINIVKKDNETLHSTSVTRTENSEYDINNSRRTENKILNNDSNLNKTKNDSRLIKDILTDDLTDFPDLRTPSQKKDNLPNGDNKNIKKDHKNVLKFTDITIHQPFEHNDRIIKKNETKTVSQKIHDNVINYEKNINKPENKLSKVIDPNYEKKSISVFTLIETPNYGTVSFIGQRFEKIEIDQWRDD